MEATVELSLLLTCMPIKQIPFLFLSSDSFLLLSFIHISLFLLLPPFNTQFLRFLNSLICKYSHTLLSHSHGGLAIGFYSYLIISLASCFHLGFQICHKNSLFFKSTGKIFVFYSTLCFGLLHSFQQ